MRKKFQKKISENATIFENAVCRVKKLNDDVIERDAGFYIVT